MASFSKRELYTSIILILLLANIPFINSATEEGYGEGNDVLGQFTDSFEDTNNITVMNNVIRNTTLNCIELNTTIGTAYGNFSNGIEIVIDYSRINIDLNLTNFPVLLNISNSAGIDDDDLTYIFDEIGDSYLKIAITNVEQDLEYYIEVEYWNRTEEIGYLWVSYNVSRLENTTIRFFYDATAPNNTAYVGLSGSVVASNVWDNNFLCVLHLNQESGNFKDSSGYNNDATEQGDGVTRGQYIIDGGIDIAGTNDYARIEDATIDNNLDRLTIEAWVNADSYGGADKAVVGDWGANQVFLLYYDFAPNNKWRMLFRDNLGGVKDVFFGANPPTAGTLYYLGATFRRNSKVRGYQNGVLTDGDIIGDITTGSTNEKIAIGEEVAGGDKDFIGKIDEFRLSNMSRTTAYFITTDFTGRDDLVDWTIPIMSGEIYFDNGYFITTDYLNYTTGNSLAILTNTTIVEDSSITIQFSNDNNTWVDNEGNVGSNTLLDGFYALDLRDLNYSDIYSMVNLSSNTIVTPLLWQLRLVTTLGVGGDIIIANETIVTVNVTGDWIEYNLTEIDVLVGTHDTGDINSTLDIDGDTFNCSEIAGTPAYIVSFNWTDVDTDAHCLWVTGYIYYDGTNNHVINIDLWNFDSSSWVTIGNIIDMDGFEWVNVSIYVLRLPNDYINSTGAVLGRFNHVTNGNINDDIHIEYLKLSAFIPTEISEGALEDYAGLFIIGLVIGLILGIGTSKL